MSILAIPPEARAKSRAASLLRSDLLNICERWREADNTAWRAAVAGKHNDREAAEAERQEAQGEFYGAGMALAELFLLLVRHALEYRPNEVAIHLGDALAGPLGELAEAIATVERTPKS